MSPQGLESPYCRTKRYVINWVVLHVLNVRLGCSYCGRECEKKGGDSSARLRWIWQKLQRKFSCWLSRDGEDTHLPLTTALSCIETSCETSTCGVVCMLGPSRSSMLKSRGPVVTDLDDGKLRVDKSTTRIVFLLSIWTLQPSSRLESLQ